MATYDQSPYVVSSVKGGYRKQECSTDGFVGMTERESEQLGWYHVLLPVILTATVVFALLTAFNRFDTANFLWYWSAILGAASSFAFTAAFGTPAGQTGPPAAAGRLCGFRLQRRSGDEPQGQ